VRGSSIRRRSQGQSQRSEWLIQTLVVGTVAINGLSATAGTSLHIASEDVQLSFADAAVRAGLSIRSSVFFLLPVANPLKDFVTDAEPLGILLYLINVFRKLLIEPIRAQTPPSLNSRSSDHFAHGRVDIMPHACIQLPLQLSIINFLIGSKQLVVERTEAPLLDAFERFELISVGRDLDPGRVDCNSSAHNGAARIQRLRMCKARFSTFIAASFTASLKVGCA
jgi:hypothetical protein